MAEQKHLNGVMASILAQIVKKAQAESLTLPTIVVGDDNKSAKNPYIAFVSPAEEDTQALTSAWYSTDCMGMIIIMESSKPKAYQLAKSLIKYIRQERMAIPLVDTAGNVIGKKRLDSLSQREMMNDGVSLFGMSITISWQEQASYTVEVGTLMGDLLVDAREY